MLTSKLCTGKQKVAQALDGLMSGQTNLVSSASLPSLCCRRKRRRENLGTRLWPNYLHQLQWRKNCILFVLLLASTLVSTWNCNLELALAIASPNKKKVSFILVLLLALLFVSICFRGEIRDLMNVLVLASQLTTRENMHESLSRLKYSSPYLAMVLFKLALQVQAHNIRN